jgi:hypothetical protein
MTYKRNQIEEAIARLFDPNCQHPSSDLRMRIRRLLEFDRDAGRKVRSKDAEEANFAFFSDEAPGSGADVSFSEYEAFALVNALILMANRWPPSFAVSVMRRVRRDLEREHRRILQQDPVKLFDAKAILERARPGALALSNTDPVFIVLAPKMPRDTDESQAAPACAVCHGEEKIGEFAREIDAASVTFFEVVTLAHRLNQELRKTGPRPRGRG